MTKTLILITTLFIACCCTSPQLVTQPHAIYTLSLFDQQNSKIATGELIFDSSIHEGSLTGTWHIRRLPAPTTAQTGDIQTNQGDGAFIGTCHNADIRIGLNPNMADNNLYLDGQFQQNQITGDWTYASFAGGDVQGHFIAVKK